MSVEDQPAPDSGRDDAVIQGLYAAAAGIVPWTTPLEALRLAIGAHAIQLVIVDKNTGRLVSSEQSPVGLGPTGVDSLLEHFLGIHKAGAHMSHIATRPVGQRMRDAENSSRGKFNDHPTYREFWLADQARRLLAATVAADERHVAMFGMIRSDDHEPCSNWEIQQLNVYLGHLAAAFRITQQLRKVHGAAAAGSALIESSDRPTFLLDSTARIVSANSKARDFLELRTALYEENAILRSTDAPSEQWLWKTLAQMGSQSLKGTMEGTKGRTVRRIPDESDSVLCSVWMLRSDTSLGIFAAQPVALLTISRPSLHSRERIDPNYLGALFDLTPAEVRVASALVDGKTLKDAAEELRLSVETVRSQLKSIYAKTDTHRQGQLVELLIRVTT